MAHPALSETNSMQPTLGQGGDVSHEDLDYLVAHPLRPLVQAGAITLVLFGFAASSVVWLSSGTVPASELVPWSICCAIFCSIWLVVIVIMLIRKPSPHETVVVWGRVARLIIIGSNGLVVTAIWLFFDHLPETSRLVIMCFCLSFCPIQMIASPENVLVTRLGVLATNGSLALWAWLAGGPASMMVSFYAVGIGIALLMFGGIAKNAVLQAVSARQESEQNARKLAMALAAVAQERDAKTRFMAAASHDLGQPLQAASLYFDQTLVARDPSQRTNAIEGVRKAFDATEQLLAHMLNHLRLDADAVEPQFAKIRLATLFQSLAKQYKPLADKAGIDISVFAGRFEVYSDKVLLERALGNLVNNAIHHSQGTRVLLVARPLPQSGLRLWVLDDGCGVKADDAPLIFSDYYRGEQANGLGVVGFGLGLSSVKRIAHLLGGEAGLEPRWKTGAAFYIDLAQGAVLGSRTTSQQRKPT
jgi:signal transduction histidine kinase